MQRRSPRRVFLAVQWGAESWDEAPLWCDTILAAVGAAPVCWNLPALPPDGRGRGRDGLVKLLASRLEGGDSLAGMGFRGACLPLLSIDEMEKELAWGLRNPWLTGLHDVFGVSPSLLLPRAADLVRPAALEAACKHGFTAIGVAQGGPMRLWQASPGIAAFSFHWLPVAQAAGVRRQLPTHGDLVLALDISGLSSPHLLQAALDGIVAPLLPFAARFPGEEIMRACEARRGGMPLPGKAPAGAGTLADGVFQTPALRERLAQAAPLSRKRRKKVEEHVRLLELLSNGPADTPAEPAVPREGGDGRVPVAPMLGEVTLAGQQFDLKISGGRFQGLSRRGQSLVPQKRAISCLRIGGRTRVFREKGAFSFETDDGIGLREELGLDGGPESLLGVEYSFHDGSPLLLLEADIVYPALDPDSVVEECVPFSFVVREVDGSSASVESSAPDGSQARVQVSEGEGWIAVPGALHRIALDGGQWLAVRWPGHRQAGRARGPHEEARHWGLPFFRVSRCLGRKRGLEISPFGSAPGTAGRWLSGRRETFALLLGIEGR